MNRVELKENAKKSLKGKWGEAILVLVVFGLISLAVSAIGLINNPNALSSPENLSQFLDSPNQFNFG